MAEKEIQKGKTLFVESLGLPKIHLFGTSADSTVRLHYDSGDVFIMLDDDAENLTVGTAKA